MHEAERSGEETRDLVSASPEAEMAPRVDIFKRTVVERNHTHLYALIAGELSGDTLGAGLMKAILRRDPDAEFIGIGGPKMCALGLKSFVPLEKLSFMGIFEVLGHLCSLLRIRRQVTKYIIEQRPCVLVGIDAPDFNLTVETKVRKAGIPTVHYVSPSVWAWREGRMKKIRKACDEVLALLPFEKDFYDEKEMPCTYVGHSLASTIPLSIDESAAKSRIGFYKHCIGGQHKVLGILPGSRRGIMERMIPIYAQVARELLKTMPDLTFISLAPNKEKAMLIKDIWLAHVPEISITVFVGNNQDVITATDVCLVTSGTIAFEVMLLKRPMTVAYKVSWFSAFIARRLLKINRFSLPNLLARREIVKEYIQEDCTVENLTKECLNLLASDNLLMKKEFAVIHERIRTSSDDRAADAVFRLLGRYEDDAIAASFAIVEKGPDLSAEERKALHERVEPSIDSHELFKGLEDSTIEQLRQDQPGEAVQSGFSLEDILNMPQNMQQKKRRKRRKPRVKEQQQENSAV